MIQSKRVVSILAAVALWLPVVGIDAAPDGGAAKGEKAMSAAVGLFPVYRPPLRGAPERRIGGGTRGAQVSMVLQALVPQQTGLTVSAQPTLYWYISSVSTVRLQLTLIDEQSIEPLLELELQESVAPGIHPFSLAEHGIRLQPDTEYQWFVAIIPDPSQRSGDLLAGGVIERVTPPPQGLEQALAMAGKDRAAFVYAEHGFWYDALDAVSSRIRRHPGEAGPRAQRAALLEQVGLQEAARFDRQGAGK